MTFLEEAAAHADACPEAPAITFVTPGATPHTVTRAELFRGARAVAGQVRAATAPGDRVLVALPTGAEFVAALLGTLAAGRVAVPAPADPGPRTTTRLRRIAEDAGCGLALTRHPLPGAVPPDLRHEPDPRLEPADLAVLQYTSGSTAEPKGVRVRTANLDANLAAIERAFEVREADVIAGWLPLFHDMGLVGTLLLPLRMGLHTILLAPEHFVRHPETWLRVISEFGVTTSGGPDFGYSWCADRVDPALLDGVDLGSWRVAFTGSEPISARTMDRFSRTFAERGFHATAFTPCYGLAESTLLVSSAPVGAAPRITELGVSCGRPVEDVLITGGEIWVRGPSVADGYHGDASNEDFGLRAPDGSTGWLRTGDLGVLHDGDLYVRGRAKDLVILRGQNHHPHDLELIATEVPGVLAACAFATAGEPERLVLAVEARGNAEEIVEQVRLVFREALAVEPDEVVIVRARKLPRTTSGKLQRGACRTAWAADELPVAHRWVAGGGRAPETPTELALAELWQELLGVRVDSVDASFFAVGGASVLAVELSARIADRLGVDVSPADLLTAGTLSAQASAIARAPRAAAAVPDPDEAPLSLQQQGLWLLAQLSPDGLPPVSVTLDVPEGADVEAAVATLVRRHPGLSTAGPDARGRQRVVPWTGAEGRPDMAAGRPFTVRYGDGELELSFDHRVIDGWSVRVVVEELDALLAGRPLRPAPPSALAWAVAQRTALADGVSADDLAFWRERHPDPAVDLPWRDPEATGAGLSTHPVAGVDVLKKRAQELDTTVAALVLAAVAVVLGRQSGQRAVAIAVPFANRTPPWTRTVGCLVSMQRVVARLPAGITGTALVRQLTRELQDLRERATVPLESLPAHLGLPRSAGQVEVVFDHLHVPAQVGGITVRDTSLEQCPPEAKVPLTITAIEGDDLRLALLRQRAYLGDEAAAEFADQVALALDALVHEPRSACQAWSLRTTRAHSRAPVSAEPIPTPDVSSVPEQVLAVDPDRTAVRCGATTWTYGDLHTQALRVTGSLQAAGIRPGDVVGVLGSAGFDTVAAALGTMLAGGVLLHLDRRLPPGRLAMMMREAQARVVVRADGDGPRDAELGPLVEIGTEAGRAVTIDPGMPGYVVFSTGSTSTPKVIVGTHRGLAHFLGWQRREFGVGEGDRFVSLTNLAFDMALRDVWLPLTTGAELHVLDDVVDVSGDHVVPLLRTWGITRLHLVPTLARSWLATTDPVSVPSLRSVFFAGEALTDTLVARFRDHFRGDYEVLNFYGPSETTQTKIFYRVPDRPEPGVQPVGRPLPQTAVTLVNDAGLPCGLGEPGEIVIRTPFATNGYANEPAAQAERFVPDPLGSGQTAYRSGDLGRVRLDGVIEILGRGDRQVKVHGVAVDPAEVADLLAGLPGVRQAAVRAEPVPGDNGAGDHRLVAWFVADRPWPALREELADRLPDALVPEHATACAELSVHPNGKVDVRSLPAPDIEAPVSAEQPKDAVEEKILDAWRVTLAQPALDMRADFFLHGGHSLKALELATALRRELGRDVPLIDILRSRTPKELARCLRDSAPKAEAPLPALVQAPEDAHEPFPMTPVQEAYWVGRRDFLELGGAAAQTYRELSCAPDLDLPRLEHAFQRLVERHPALRTVATDDGRQRVLPRTPPFRIAVQDLRDDPDPEAGVTAWRDEMGHRVRPLEEWPLIEARASLLPGEVRLHIGLDAWMCDAWSRVQLVDELRDLYAEPSRDLQPLGLTFRDYVLNVEGAPNEADLEWWHAQLDELPEPPRLPLARRTGTGFTRRHGRLESDAWTEFQGRAAHAGITASAALLAAFGWVLDRWSTGDRMVLNVTAFRRLPVHPDVVRILGDFTSVLPHSMTPRWDSFHEHARDVQTRLWEELAHDSVSGVHLTRELARRTGRLDATGLPVVFTSALTSPELGRQFDWTWLGELVHGISQTPQVWLDLQVYEHRGELHHNWDAIEEMFEPGVLDAMFEAWSELLRTLVAEPWDRPVPDLLPESQRLLQQRTNDTAAPAVAETLVDGVLATLERTPDAAAVIDGDVVLGYARLVAEAETVAAALLAERVPRGGLVAIVVPHGWRQAVAALGVHLAGAAYVPVDASQPAARIRDILAEAAPDLVLRAGASWPDGIDLETLPAKRERRLPRPHDTAYVIYTSGSTGRPKGVVIRHEAAVNTLVDIERQMKLGATDRVLALSQLAFDLSVWDLFGTWQVGAAVVYPADRNDPAAWVSAALAHEVRVWNSVPALAQMLVDALAANPELPAPELRTVLLSGDWIPLRLPDRLRELAPDAAVWSLGGATEASIWSIAYPVRDIDDSWTSIPYGRPLANQTVEVLDGRLRPCPVYVTGRLFIGGRGVADGYWRDEQRTAERFVECRGARLYDTGDLGRWLPDGTIEILGRADTQVKIRGYRVELGEIEHVLESLAGVARAAVVVTGDPRGDRRLVGFAVASAGAGLTDELLRKELSARLPEQMVPYACVVLDALPLSANGKVDRAALGDLVPVPELGPRLDSGLGSGAEVLAAAWAEVLGAPPADSAANFFMVGGDSITWLRVCAQVARTGWRLPAGAIAGDAAFGVLSTHLRPPVALVPTVPAPAGPTPPAPMRAWLAARGMPGHFNQAVLLRLLRPLDSAMLDRALAAVVDCHPALNGHVLEHGSDIAAACRGFTIDGSLLRATLSPDHLLLCAHHIAVDAQSWRVIVGDLEEALDAFAAGRDPDLFPETTTYAQWCHAVAELPVTVSPPELPPAVDAGTERDARVTKVELPVGPEDVRAAVQRLRCTEEEFLLAAAAWTEGTVSGRWAVEVERHGRMLGALDLGRTVGWLTALVPIPVQPGEPADVLVQVKAQLRALPDGGLALAAAHAPSGRSAGVVVNPLGPLGDEASSRFELVRDPDLPLRDPDLPRANERRVTLYSANGTHWAELNHRGEAGEWPNVLCTAVTRLVETPATDTVSAADFPASGLPDDELRALLAGLEVTDD